MQSFFKLLVNPVDAVLFQPPKPTYTTHPEQRGTLAADCSVVCLDNQGGLFAVETPRDTDQDTCLVWAHGNTCDCGEESAGFVGLAKKLNVVIIGVECTLLRR